MDADGQTIAGLAATVLATANDSLSDGPSEPAGWRATLGIGVDVERIERWAEPDQRLFTDGERAHCEKGSGLDRRARYAGRWCAKEAVLKAFSGQEELTLRDIEVAAGPRGEPRVILADRLAAKGWTARVSIAHDPVHAVAVAVATR